jgi:Type IV secretory system Conjugative DNA transfer
VTYDTWSGNLLYYRVLRLERDQLCDQCAGHVDVWRRSGSPVRQSYVVALFFSRAFTGANAVITSIFLLVLVGIWWKPVRKLIAALTAAAFVLLAPVWSARAYYDKQDFAEVYFILPNESAFFIPDTGANKDSQAAFGPSLRTWPGSAIVHDFKGENWTLTAGFRARHGRVLLFDPTNSASAAYNPLLEVRRGEWEIRDVQNIADILVDPEGSLDRRNHWEKTSHSLLVGAILHVLYAEEDKTLAGVAAFLSDPRRPIETTLAMMMCTPHLGAAAGAAPSARKFAPLTPARS